MTNKQATIHASGYYLKKAYPDHYETLSKMDLEEFVEDNLAMGIRREFAEEITEMIEELGEKIASND